MSNLDRLSQTQIRNRLQATPDPTEDAPGYLRQGALNPAAVLVPLVREQGAWHLLFIRRAEHEDDYHGGQVAFAGGKHEPDDADLLTTALREAEEEVGIEPDDVTVLGQLNDHHSISRFRIRPVVARIPWPYRLQPDPREVARVFTIPLNWLANPGHHYIRQRRLTPDRSVPVVYFKEYDGEQLWGATARMTLSLVSLLRD